MRFNLANPIPKGTSTTYTFAYSGTLEGTETSPVEGIKLASIDDPISILLYPGRWFPMVGLYTSRRHPRCTSAYRVMSVSSALDQAFDRRVFPATAPSSPSNGPSRAFRAPSSLASSLTPLPFPASTICGSSSLKHQADAADFAHTASRQFEFMTTTFGQPESTHVNLVESPDDAVSATWAPEIAAIAGGRLAAKNYQRLLSNTLAHQWWGSEVSPATLNDAWITNGMSRYAELMYLEDLLAVLPLSPLSLTSPPARSPTTPSP